MSKCSLELICSAVRSSLYKCNLTEFDDRIHLNCKTALIQVEGEKINSESEADERTIREKKVEKTKPKRETNILNVRLDDAEGERNRKIERE